MLIRQILNGTMGQRDNVAFEIIHSINIFLHYSGTEIWKRIENFVLLQCQMRVVETAEIKGKNCES